MNGGGEALYCTDGALSYAKRAADGGGSDNGSALPGVASGIGSLLERGVRLGGERAVQSHAALRGLERLERHRRENRMRCIADARAAAADASIVTVPEVWGGAWRGGFNEYARSFKARAEALAVQHADTTMHAFGLLEREMLASRAGDAKEEADLRRKREHAQAVNDLSLFSLHLALETCGRATLRRLPPTDSQHIRCRRACLNNVRPEFFSQSGSPAMSPSPSRSASPLNVGAVSSDARLRGGAGSSTPLGDLSPHSRDERSGGFASIDVLGVLKLENKLLLERFRAVRERAGSGGVKGLFCTVEADAVSRIAALGFGSAGANAPDAISAAERAALLKGTWFAHVDAARSKFNGATASCAATLERRKATVSGSVEGGDKSATDEGTAAVAEATVDRAPPVTLPCVFSRHSTPKARLPGDRYAGGSHSSAAAASAAVAGQSRLAARRAAKASAAAELRLIDDAASDAFSAAAQTFGAEDEGADPERIRYILLCRFFVGKLYVTDGSYKGFPSATPLDSTHVPYDSMFNPTVRDTRRAASFRARLVLARAHHFPSLPAHAAPPLSLPRASLDGGVPRAARNTHSAGILHRGTVPKAEHERGGARDVRLRGADPADAHPICPLARSRFGARVLRTDRQRARRGSPDGVRVAVMRGSQQPAQRYRPIAPRRGGESKGRRGGEERRQRACVLRSGAGESGAP